MAKELPTRSVKSTGITNNNGRRRIVIQDEYDLEADLAVPHSGTTDKKTGRPRYDESPVRGGAIQNYIGEIVNHKGHEIDPETGEVLAPERYKDENRSEL